MLIEEKLRARRRLRWAVECGKRAATFLPQFLRALKPHFLRHPVERIDRELTTLLRAPSMMARPQGGGGVQATSR